MSRRRDTRTIASRVPRELADQVDRAAQQRGTTKSTFIRQAVENALRQNRKEKKDA